MRAGDAELSSGGSDALDRQLHIVILLQRRSDQFLQLRIVEHLPPGQIGERDGLWLCLLRWIGAAESRGWLHGRPMIVGSDRTAGEHGGRHEKDPCGSCAESVSESITHLDYPQ